jgi:alpha-N-arabinofuranosidase
VDALSPEASHIYKKDGWYYLMIAEGGTEHNHCVAVARSRNVSGPYHGYEANPILTHRHLSYYYPICNVGHGDLVELKDGSWYMVMLASRLYGGYHKNLGRETFIAPVIWEHDWPAVSPGTGKVEWEYPSPALPETVYPQLPELDHFDSETLDMRWNFLGVPVNPVWEVRDSCLCLKTIAEPICPPEPPVGGPPFDGRAPLNVRALSLLGRRQQHMSFSASAALKFDVQDDDTAGICLLQNGFTQLRLEIALNDGRKAARVVKVTVQGEFMSQHYETEVLGCREITGDELELEVTAREQSHSFYITSGGKKLTVAEDIDGSFLGSESAGGFVGTYIALFASGNGRDTGREAKFDWFKYAPII